MRESVRRETEISCASEENLGVRTKMINYNHDFIRFLGEKFIVKSNFVVLREHFSFHRESNSESEKRT